MFGNPIIGEESYFKIDVYILYSTRGTLVARLKPPIASARILSIDSSGIRGVIPLEFLGLL